MSLGETLYWRDRNMPEPPLEPPADQEGGEEWDAAFHVVAWDCTSCTHQDENCKLRQTFGNGAAMVCVDYEEEK